MRLTDMKKMIILILVAVFSYWGLNNFEILMGALKTLYQILSPFIIGGALAFILNIPMTKIENLLNKVIKKKTKLVRGFSILLSLMIFVVIILFIAFLLIPELIENVKMLMSSIPTLVDKTEVFVLNLLDKYPDIQVQIEETFASITNISNVISNVLNYFINGAIGFVSGLISGIVTIFTALIFSIYLLSQKEYIVKGTKKLIYAFLNKEKAHKLTEIGSLANKTFSKFISGQCTEAVILGVIMFVAFTIFRFPYALIIAVLTAVTALIPVFGAMIAMVVGAILIAITDPVQAIVFIIIFQVVQQIEGNFIYPRVVGKSVGLSPMWTLLAISVGGKLFGIIGMLIGLPLASVIYALIVELTNDKLKEKNIKVV